MTEGVAAQENRLDSSTHEIIGWSTGYVDRHPITALRTVGGQCVLAVRAFQYFFIDLARARFPFGEFVEQATFMARTAAVPTLFIAVPLSVTLAIQFSLLAGQLGATSLAGAANGLAVLRQGAPLVAAVLMAAAVGSATGADLGSRKIREETDAMEVMGVSVIRRLVVPRLAASMLIATALTGFACFIGFLAGYAFTVMLQGGTPGSYTATFSSFATVDDLILTLLKAVVFGAIVAIISCYKGLDARGGPAGVANSVNAAVVQSVLVLLLVNVLMSQMYLILFPKTSF
ncbi:ABC transporter [Mycobacterium intermedium]|uniref:ABC transporter n=1 Tax=Mycobacterium intermedium TaxID=28445 RepID=A0A1E3SMU5_MYCIE|nr:ABC transporter permease [Mycobacterium intermedium]MCV6963479.1 ABC transporter permease [Mycobacterium intermedium]ODR02858.1 ABC transporter [Mycobacterium intermedium]OPE49914.1 ABC transporter [Mycobacterium intermedium]ORB02765.1 ABC transporter [Mycobacterium intermedium]